IPAVSIRICTSPPRGSPSSISSTDHGSSIPQRIAPFVFIRVRPLACAGFHVTASTLRYELEHALVGWQRISADNWSIDHIATGDAPHAAENTPESSASTVDTATADARTPPRPETRGRPPDTTGSRPLR